VFCSLGKHLPTLSSQQHPRTAAPSGSQFQKCRSPPRRDRPSPPTLIAPVDVAWHMIFAAWVQQVMIDNKDVGDVPTGKRNLVREITRCVVAYLTCVTSKD